MKLMKKDRKTNFKFAQIVILILLFLGNMNVRNLYVYFLFGASVIGILMNGRFLRVDGMVAVLLLLSLSYVVFDPIASDSLTTVIKQFLFPMCYLMGLNFVRGEGAAELGEREERQISTAIAVCAMGAFGHYLMNMALNFGSAFRNNVDIWTGEILSATGQAALAVFALAVFSAWLFDTKRKKIPAILGLILIMAYNLVLAGRTLILLTVMVLCVSFFFAIRTTQSRRKGRLLLMLLLALIAVLTAYVENWFGVRDWLLGSNLSTRFDVMGWGQDTRMENKRLYLEHFLDYPFGGGYLRSELGVYAHELYLDTYNDTGVMGYVLILVFVANSTVTAWQCIRKGDISNDFKLLILCVYIAVLAEFFLEPIMRGMPWMFCTFCFFSGLLKNVKTTNRSGRSQTKDVE